MGVGNNPEIENETSAGQDDDLTPSKTKGGRKNDVKKRAAEAADVEVLDSGDPAAAKDRRASRERSLHRLLAGMRSINSGDFSVRLTPNGDPLMAEIIDSFNQLADKRTGFTGELVRVSNSVGREGNMRDRFSMGAVGGAWATSVDAINGLIQDLGQPTSEVSRVIQAVAEGDLSQKVELEIQGKQVQGEFFRIGSTVNRMVDQLNAFASEVTRVAREVGTEGKLGGQAEVQGVSGTWKDLTDSVNAMASNLTGQVRNIADVTTAVAKGDLSRKITVEAKGEVLALKSTINTMVDQLSAFASEVTRVAREVGTEGILGGQADVPGVAGTWKDLTDNVNFMASNLTNQVRNIAVVTTAVANGDLSQKITVEVSGEILELKDTINDMVEKLRIFADEVTRVAKEVGTEGVLGGQANVPGVAGTWKALTDNVNAMAGNLTAQVRNIADVTTAVARGDLSRKITVDVRGEVLELKNTINTMVDQLNAFASEVTRVAKEVGTEGKLGGQARVEGVAGTWKDLTENVNGMASNLTVQLRDVSAVSAAIANGDLTRKITVEAQGEILQIKEVVNKMVDQLNSFAGEVIRVAREVGTDGILGGQANVPGVAGTWKNLTDNVNGMASNLTGQVRNVAAVTTAVANGDLSQKITVEAQGEMLELKSTINTMVDQLNSFASEVIRVAREVGTQGILGGQASVPGVGGTWKDLTDNVNFMALNLTNQVRNIAVVTTAVANGDLSQKITVEVSGEILELKDTFNNMVEKLRIFADEVTRVAKEVGTEGVLGGQANVPGVAGTWKALTDNVNAMAGNLTAQVRNIADVTTAVARGDLSRKITVDVQGEVLELKNTINRMVDQLNSFAGEVIRVAREVGTEGTLGGQANVPGVAGTWKSLTDNVNGMAGNLTNQVRNIADVTTAVAKGDLSRKITVEAKGEVLALKQTINTMVDQLSAFAGEVTRVAREVGTEGILGGQANVPGVAGTWKDLTDNVNFMASNLTNQVRNIALVTTAVANGDLSQKITADVRGEVLELKDTINNMVEKLRIFADEVSRVAREVGTEGRLGGQASVPGVGGTWKDLTDNVNAMAGNLTVQVRNIADVTTAVARGDLSRKITVDVRGEILELKNTVNTMVDQLNAFAGEVTRVAREVGTEGKLGGQAKVPGAAGVWRDLTDNVNGLAANLTTQVRNIADVTTAVATGDLSQKITVEAQGEVLSLKSTINNMVDRLRVFADEVTRVAKEVGTEGKLGGQADVPGVAGTWKALTDSVNAMANSLTVQVRNIADVATAVTKGDLTRQITVDAQGELDELKTNINQMIGNLRETTKQNQEQDWLKTNLAKFSRMMQGQKDLESVSRLIMSELTPLVSAHHGAFFIADRDANSDDLKLIASYAYRARKHVANRFAPGEGLVGQAALEKQPILLQNVPDDYIQITSGLGEAPPRNIIVLPILFEGGVKAVIELASFLPFSQIHQTFLDQLTESIGVVLNMIQANMRTEELLEQSQKLTQELQSQSEELRTQQDDLKKSNVELEQQAKTLRQSEELLKEQQEELQQVNEELEEKASLLAEQNSKVEQKNREVESARQALEEKAQQLALSSKYKSEFLANMSHELRTPLNSLLILAKLLQENKDKNLSKKQVEFAQTIYSSGSDLLNLINDILDLSKVEAGKMEISPTDMPLSEMESFVMRTFKPVADQKGLDLKVDIQPDAPSPVYTDPQRVQQVVKNLLSNAFKFTQHGSIALTICKAEKDRKFASRSLDSAEQVVAFQVSDTGMGIPKEKQQLIFEAFQQADGTTSRKFGGTGLGLSISREIARLLGGEIKVESVPGKGSTFTLFLPARYIDPDPGESQRALVRARKVERRRRAVSVPPEHIAERRAEGRSLTAIAASASQDDDLHSWDDDGGVATIAPPRRTLPMPEGIEDDREGIVPGDRVVLVVENDVPFAKILLDMAHDKGFKGIVTVDGDSALEAAHIYQPDAITLDIDLPGMDGWTVLDRLKHHPNTRHIPVHIISGIRERQQGLKAGAIEYLEKPVTRDALENSFNKIAQFIDQPVRRLLVVEDDATQRTSMVELIAHEDVEITAVGNADEALAKLHEGKFDCMVLDLGLAGETDGFGLLEKVKSDPSMNEIPIIIYTGKSLSPAEETRLRKFAETIIVKDVKSPERLLDETALFLHRVEARMPEQKRRMLERLHNADAVFAGKRVLVVDDDVRNIFSLTSVLEDHGMTVSFAENGRDGIAKLEETPGIDLVLMDVMMPEMDGYETMRAIREKQEFVSLPIIALTAKAMKGDREKCIAAGASDYITKPVDTDQLLSLMRVWLYR
jgi:HAMP domain-containing protein/signal transduction histidine kinase/CheY-like chemotaxis protein